MKLSICKAFAAVAGLTFVLAQAQEKDNGAIESIDKFDVSDGVEPPEAIKLDPNNSAAAVKAALGNLTLPDAEPGKPQQKQTIELPESVKRLSQAQQFEIQRLLGEAAGFIQGIRLQEGLDRLIQIETITVDLFETHNLRGAIYTKLRDFDKARKSFQQALKLRNDKMEAYFNLAELDFVERKFADAQKSFEKIQKDFVIKLTPETSKLIDYKLFISVLRQSTAAGDTKEKEALKILSGFSYLDEWPVFYYSNAALAFHRAKQEEAQSWLSSAENIYSKPVQSIYIDALIEMGWLDSL